MPRTIVPSVVPSAIVAAARHVPATDAHRAVDPMIAAGLVANARRAGNTHRARSVWNFRSPLSFYRSRSGWPLSFGRFTIPKGRIR